MAGERHFFAGQCLSEYVRVLDRNHFIIGCMPDECRWCLPVDPVSKDRSLIMAGCAVSE
jgi:hypothetical protein